MRMNLFRLICMNPKLHKIINGQFIIFIAKYIILLHISMLMTAFVILFIEHFLHFIKMLVWQNKLNIWYIFIEFKLHCLLSYNENKWS